MSPKRILLFQIIGFLAVSCSNTHEATEAELSLTREQAQIQAQRAISHADGSMERERAIFEIRSIETKLRQAGFNECADTFASTAHRIIFSKIQE